MSRRFSHVVENFINIRHILNTMNRQITLQAIYTAVERLERELREVKTRLESVRSDGEAYDWDGAVALADESLLGEAWLSEEDEHAFTYLQ